jgi:hypothetical protein
LTSSAPFSNQVNDSPDQVCADTKPVVTENSVRSENAEVPVAREIMVAAILAEAAANWFESGFCTIFVVVRMDTGSYSEAPRGCEPTTGVAGRL